MQKKLSVIFFTLILCTLSAYAQLNITEASRVSYSNVETSDIWGYTAPDNREYGIVTTSQSVHIVDVTVPSNPVEKLAVTGLPDTYWRDAKAWNQYAYVVSEGGLGLQIINLSNLPNNLSQSDVTYWTSGSWSGGNVSFSTAHDIYIDEFGYAYILGANYGVGGAIILDLNVSPTNPPVVGVYDERYVHDAFVRDNIMWSAEVYSGIFSVVDVSNKANPTVLATQATTGGVTHNIWLSDDSQTAFTTDESGGAFIEAYDVSNLGNITLIDKYQSSPGLNVIPHNVFVYNDFLVISYYKDGVVVVDASNPRKMIEVGNFDTFDASQNNNHTGGGFNGCWGVFPYFDSETILATSFEENGSDNYLFVLSPNYQRAAFLEGIVTDASNGNPLFNVNITITEDATGNTTTAFAGDYITGFVNGGTYTATYTASGYISQTVTVTLVNGNIVIQNIALQPQVAFSYTGQVIDAATNAPISGAEIILNDGLTEYSTTTSGSGNFNMALPGANTYSIYVGQWGYITKLTSSTIDPANSTVTISLDKGYYDDFVLDFGWTVSGNASTGIWELGEPIGTSYNSTNDSNPDVDISSDLGNQCYVTGNGGGGAGNDDVDDGTVVLSSPIFDLTNYGSAEISYYRWFFNAGGNGTPDDVYEIKLSNGSTTVTIETLTANSPQSQWQQNSFIVSDYITPTANMQFIAETGDLGDGHLVEAGLDLFEVQDLNPPIPDVTLKATVFLQGAYNNSSGLMSTALKSNNLIPTNQPFNANPWNYTGNESVSSTAAIPSNVVDWVLVEARAASDINQVLETKAAFLTSNGNLINTNGTAGVTFSTLTNGASYYIVIRHRNHLAVVSATAFDVANTANFDFTNPNNVFGNNSQVTLLGGALYGLHAGDINADGVISVADFNFYKVELSTTNQYTDSDSELNGSTTIGDFNKYKPNASVIGVRTIRY